ncbi:MAG: T9SS type A sorting domain-containing protein, partial [Bacteroidia bacterium]
SLIHVCGLHTDYIKSLSDPYINQQRQIQRGGMPPNSTITCGRFTLIFEDAQPRMAGIEDNEIAINDEERNYKGVLYPNPANDYVIYKTWLNEGETVTIVFYDVMGKPIISKQITGTTEEQFDLSKISSGIYFYKITLNQKQVQAGKLIINK